VVALGHLVLLPGVDQRFYGDPGPDLVAVDDDRQLSLEQSALLEQRLGLRRARLEPLLRLRDAG